ncbi:MAG TPA: hypothetical protein VFR80_00965 [Pyrinomonadaceae bacterium]|nr:hypothetical protein [Pyrinomonadaceae bacterium]
MMEFLLESDLSDSSARERRSEPLRWTIFNAPCEAESNRYAGQNQRISPEAASCALN